MSDFFGLNALPGDLPDVLEPWAQALAEADTQTAHWVREATETGAMMLASWVKFTPEIEAARKAARLASVQLADVLDRRDAAGSPSAKIAAHDAFRRLVATLVTARPDERKDALGLGW